MRHGIVVCVCTSVFACLSATAQIVKNNNTDPLNTGTSWVGGNPPGANDIAVWNDTLPGANTSPLEAAMTWDGIRVTNPGGPVTIGGTGMLTLDGGSNPDINLEAAEQDLTIAAPVTIANAEQTINVKAGRTLTLAGPLNVLRGGDWVRLGTGTVVFDGAVTSAANTSLEFRSGTNIFTGKNGGLTFTATGTGASRLYVGRHDNNYSTLIISNGVHETRATSDEANASLIGVGGGTVTTGNGGWLIVEGGTLRVPYMRTGVNDRADGGITVNGGMLEITHGSATATRSGYGLMIANNHQDNDTAVADNIRGFLTVNGGAVSVANGIISLGSKTAGSSGSAAVTLNGGEILTKRFYLNNSPLFPKTITLNGGLLRLTGGGSVFDGPGASNGSLTLIAGANGARIDTGANTLTLDAPLTGPGGLDKSGSGTLTLTAANTYAGRTRVLGGLIRFTDAAAMPADLMIASGAGLSLADGTLAPCALAAAVTIGGSAPMRLELETGTDGSSSDRLDLPGDVPQSGVAFAPVAQGTAARSTQVGNYVVLSYKGNAPDVTRFTVPDPAPFRAYNFTLDSAAKTVTLHITYAATAAEWNVTGGGRWETGGNWTVLPANAAGTSVRLGPIITSDAEVRADNLVTLGSAIFNSAFAYTLAGAGFVFDNAASAATVTVEQGAHTVSAPLTLNGDLAVTPASGASLTFSGAVGGTGRLIKDGAGDITDLTLTQPNAYSGGTEIRQGSIVLAGAATLGSGPVTATGTSGIRVMTAAALTLDNSITLAAPLTFNASASNLELTGGIDWQGDGTQLIKSGGNELALSGSGSETAWARFQIDSGRLTFKDGASFALMNKSNRDVFSMKRNNSESRDVVFEAGSSVTAAAFDMEYGTANNVYINGGTLRLLGGGGNNDALAMRGNGAGTDRFEVNSGLLTADDGQWIGVGYRWGDAHFVVNGGTATVSHVSLGARENDGSDLTARSFVEINDGGLFEVRRQFNWMGSGFSGRTNTLALNGGVWRTVATMVPRAVGGVPVMRFNGGTLEMLGDGSSSHAGVTNFLYGAKEVYVDAGGAHIDTRGLDATFRQQLLKGAATDGGLTKLGAGSLTLQDEGFFTGPTVVEQGTLTLPAAYASEGLTVASGATLSLANDATQRLSPAVIDLANGATVVLEAGDVIDLPADATVGNITVKVVVPGTDLPILQTGDITLFTFTDAEPDIQNWTLANPAPECIATLEIDGQAVVLRVVARQGVSIWTNDGPGDWSDGGNWSAPPGTIIRFAEAITAPATVTVDAAATVESLAFRNANPYTLAGLGIALDPDGTVTAERGFHTVDVALALGSGTRIETAAGAGLALNGTLSGAAPTMAGPGEFAITNPATLNVPALTLENAAAVAVANTATWGIPVTLNAGGGVFAPAAETTLDMTAAVGGDGSLTKRGSSILDIPAASYAGGTRVEAGTLRVGTWPGGDITFGQGTFEYTGAAPVPNAGGYTVDTGSGTRAGILRTDADITFNGNISAPSGTWIKAGTGTVIFAATGLNVYNTGNGAGTSHDVLDIGPYGDSPTVGFSGFNIADGKVVIGAAGQTNVFNGLLVIGLNSTTNEDAETTGMLEVNGGVTTVADALIVGRSNGNLVTAPTPRTACFLMTDGELQAYALVLGRATNKDGSITSDSVAEIAGGTFIALDMVIIGENPSVTATVKLNGGTLVTPRLYRSDGDASLIFDNGTLRPSVDGQTLGWVTTLRADAGGATFDLSLVDSYTIGQAITGEGGLTKTGAGTLVLNVKQAYEGATTVAEGRLRIPVAGGISDTAALAVMPGAELAFDGATARTLDVGALALGKAASTPASLVLGFTSDGSANDVLAATGPVTLGAIDVTLVTLGGTDAFSLSGAYTIITYTGSAPNVSEMRVTGLPYGKGYTFTAANGAVTLTLDADSSGSAAVWTHTGGGNWQEANYWTARPANTAGASARFDNSIAAPSTVTVPGATTIGNLFFNTTKGYTLDGTGPLTFDGGVETLATLNIEAGTNTFALPVEVAESGLLVTTTPNTDTVFAGALSGSGALTKDGPSDVMFSAVSTRTGPTEMLSGALVLHNGGTPGTGEIVFNKGNGMRITGTTPATLDNPMTLISSARLNVRDQPLTLSGPLDIRTGQKLQKYGANHMVLEGTGGTTANGTFQVCEGSATFADGADYVFAGTTREAVRLGAAANARTSLTIESGASITAGGLIMHADSYNLAGCDATVTQNGGSVYLTYEDALFVRQNGTAPAAYIMNAGTLAMPPTSWANVGLYGDGTIAVNGGEMTLGRFAAGYQNRPAPYGSGSAHVVVNGGRLAAVSSWSWMSEGTARYTGVTLNGGTLAIPATSFYVTNNAPYWAELTLNGGMLELTGPAVDSTATDDYLRGAKRMAVGPSGGTLYAGNADVTVRQNVDGLATTGTLAKVGGAAATLAGVNTLAALDVREGTLRARLTPLDNLPGVPLFRYKLDSADLLADSSGHGFPMIREGTGGAATDGHDGTVDGAWLFNNDSSFKIAHSPLFPQLTEFTASAWIYMTAISGGSDWSILSARPNGDIRTFEFKINNGGALRLLMHNDTGWWNEVVTTEIVPINRWAHVAVTVSREHGAKLYIDGVPKAMKDGDNDNTYTGGWPRGGDIRLAPLSTTAGLLIGRPHPTAGNRLKGSLDDVMLFDRVLSDDEIAQVHAGTAPRLATVHVDALGTYDLQNETQAVSEATGNGAIINGTLAVTERLVADEIGNGLTIANLTLGADAVYACALGEGGASGLTEVRGTLAVDGAGVIDFGRESDPVSKSFEAVVMTYGTVSGATNFENWIVTGLGMDSARATVTAENGEVIVRAKVTFGTLMILK